jgi:HSP90 family molecular chaperone
MQKLSDQSYTPKIWVDIDIANQTVKVTDNGTGISAEQFRYLLKPNIS